MKTEWLACLRAFKRFKSLNKVSELYHTTPQNVGKMFKHLEEEMGLVLFEHSGRSLILTEAGEALADAAENILSILDQVKKQYGVSETELTGSISIVGDNAELLNSILLAFNQQYPKVNISIMETDMQNGLKHVLNNPQKLAFIPLGNNAFCQQIIDEYSYALNFIPLCVDHAICLVSADSRYASYKSITYKDLKDMKIAVLIKTFSSNAYMVDLLKEEVGSTYEIITTNSPDYFYTNISKNNFAGITYGSNFANCNLSCKDHLVPLTLRDAGMHTHYLVYHASRKVFTPAEKALIKLIEQYYQALQK